MLEHGILEAQIARNVTRDLLHSNCRNRTSATDFASTAANLAGQATLRPPYTARRCSSQGEFRPVLFRHENRRHFAEADGLDAFGDGMAVLA